MNGSLVPANTKKSMLWFGMLRPIDAAILSVGVIITVFLLAVFNDVSTWLTLVFCVPMFISLILVLPIPNYHNTLVAIQSILRFYSERRNYIWRGWCVYNEFKDGK